MIFFDNASTTMVDNDILNKFNEYQNKYYFNPGALYKVSTDISSKIEETRKKIVELLKGDTNGTFIFTGTSTEANNIILNSVVTNNKNEEYVFSSLEHPSVYNYATKLLQEGRKVIFISSNPDGTINENELLGSINNNTKFVSIINVSNETGAINNVNILAKKIKEINPKTLVHADGVQALGKIEVNLSNLDYYTISSHKIHGLKGIAGFYAKNIKTLKPLILGGGQEFNIRSGTTNAPLIFSFYDVIKKAEENQNLNYAHALELKNYLLEKIKNNKDIEINSSSFGSPFIISLSILGLNAETILNMLSEKNICVGLGSACSSKKSGNRILESMHKSKASILGNLRLSFSKYNTKEEIDIFYKEFEQIIIQLKEKLS